MIRIRRTTCPAALQGIEDHGDRYTHTEVIAALAAMQHNKCCYCEKRISEAGHDRAVEHFRPKGKFPQLRNEWSNLLHACSACNGKKGAAFPTGADGHPLIIDPSNPSLDPEHHLKFWVDDEDRATFGSVTPKDDSDLVGKHTIECVGLDLSARRRERFRIYKKLYGAYIDMLEASDEITKEQTVNAFRNLLTANNEYAAFARAFARKKIVETEFSVAIPVGEELGTT